MSTAKLLNFLYIILLLINISYSWFENCDHTIYLNQTIYIASPNYPKNYYSGTSCRYQIIAPLGHEININCNVAFNTDYCSYDYFLFNTEGDETLREYDYICDSGKVQQTSLFNKLTIAYTSSSRIYSGAFSCLVTYKEQSCDCGWSGNMKIVGGTETGVIEYPFMAGLLNSVGTLFCGGSVINNHIIVTAAHCLVADTPTRIVVGAHNIKEPSQYTKYHEIQEIRKHEAYNPSTNDNDIAIISTKTFIEWSRGVGPICLPFYYEYSTFVGEAADFAGWGTTLFGGPPSDVLLKTTVDIVDNTYCASEYNDMTNEKMCTFGRTRDSCQYDSGGPVIWRNQRLQLIGIISYGKECGGNSPGVNTRITSYLDWIKRNTGKSFCEKY